MVVILGNVIIAIISSQSRLTHHQVSRIQAYYAGLAGMNFALEQLRTNAWIAGINCIPASPCNLTDTVFPHTIRNQEVSIILRAAGTAGCASPPAPADGACIETTATYTYTP